MRVLRALAVLASCVPSAALRLPVHPAVPKVAEAKAFILAAACSASLLAGAPHTALAAPTLNEAIVEVSQTSYPILKALTAETFVPFSAKIGKLVLDIAPDKLGKSIALRRGAKCRLCRATARWPGRLGRTASGLGCSMQSGGAPQPLRPQWQLMVRPSACAKVADFTALTI